MKTWWKNNRKNLSLTFGTVFSLCWLADLLSFMTYLHTWLLPLVFGFVCLATIILTWRKTVYGVYLIVAELALGSQGYLFFLPLENFKISLRIALFSLVLGLWLIKKTFIWWRTNNHSLTNWWNLILIKPLGPLYRYYLFLALAIVWGLIWGLLRQNSTLLVLTDFNNWLFFLLAPLVLDCLKDNQQRQKILVILAGATTALATRILFLEYIHGQNFILTMELFYRWLADYFLLDITFLRSNFYRIFGESQVYGLLSLALILTLLAFKNQNFKKFWLYLWAILVTAAIIISFSRSYWVGMAGGLLILSAWLIFFRRLSWPDFTRWILKLSGILIGALALILLILNLPPGKGSLNFSNALTERLTKNENAGQARLNQIRPLTQAISRHPIIGSGWGTTVTYKTSLPALKRHDNPDGEIKTFAFEWGYLDLLLKIGLAGIIIYGLLFWKTFQLGWQFIKERRADFTSEQIQVVGWLLGCLIILGVNIFSPYLNHPLGIGILILTQAWILNFKENQNVS